MKMAEPIRAVGPRKKTQDLMEGEGECGAAEPRGRAVVDGPHERQRPGAHQLYEEHAGHQRQAIGRPPLVALGVLQQGAHQQGLGALLVRALLEYSQSDEWRPAYGLSLVAGMFLIELMRSWSLALMWAVNYRTATRLRGAALTFAFHKILRLRSTKDISPGERLYDAVTVSCLLVGGALAGLLGLSYTTFFLGPTALMGSAIFIFFYPAMMLASRLTAYFRKRCVTVTDRRVRLMNEILSCIKFIKMYCWEDAFAQNVHSKQPRSAESPAEVRLEEKRFLERAGLVQSLTVGVAPVVVVIASVCTFTLHMALGYDLTAAQVMPLAMRSLTEGAVAVKRFQ
ncbi:hypothetical protein CRUP_007748, partial [Coryphaenoides rupestris]